MALGIEPLGRCVLQLHTMVTEQETSEFSWGKKSRRKGWVPKLARDSKNEEQTSFV